MIADNNLDVDVSRNDAKEIYLDPSANDAMNNRWKKCVALKESVSDVTTQEEFNKFDFQVCTNHIPIQFNMRFLTIPRTN